MSGFTYGPDWLQNLDPTGPAGFVRNELLGFDDFGRASSRFGEGDYLGAGISTLTGVGELGLTALSLFGGPKGVAARAALAGGRSGALSRGALGTAGTRFGSFISSPLRNRAAALGAQAARFTAGGGFGRFGSEDPAAAAEAEADADADAALAGLDWDAILGSIAAGGGGTPRVSVPRGMFNLAETQAEQAMLARELANIEARAAAGEVALRAGWGEVQAANSAAADKARAMVAEVGDVGASYWTDAAERARNISAEAAAEAGGFEGRAGIDISPTAGSENWVGFMESQAPAERRFAERSQEILGEDLEWMAGMAGQQAQAQVGDLQRQAQFISFDRAREHNMRVQDRINQERMILAQMEMQAQATNAQLASADRTAGDPYRQFEEDVMRAITVGDPGLLVAKYGIPLEQAEAAVARMAGGLGQLRALQT